MAIENFIDQKTGEDAIFSKSEFSVKIEQSNFSWGLKSQDEEEKAKAKTSATNGNDDESEKLIDDPQKG